MAIKKKTVFEVGSPAWIFAEEELRRNIKAFRRAAADEGLSLTVAYSVKTNSAPEVLDCIRHNNCLAEVVSHDEWQMVTLCGFPSQMIVYNGPMKGKASLQQALRAGAIVNLECHREVEWLMELLQEKEDAVDYKVGVRVNIDIASSAAHDTNRWNTASRFGFNEKSGELSAVVSQLKELPGVTIAGLHMHRSTSARRVSHYRAIAQYAADIIERYNLRCHLEWIDIGGGYHETMPGKPSIANYIHAVKEVLAENNLADIHIIVEPGNALISTAFFLVSEVIDVKAIDDVGNYIVTTDISRNDIDPLFKKNDFLRQTYYATDRSTRPVVKRQEISGCTCIEQDRLFNVENAPLLKPGDRILYRNVGAYTLTLSPQFIRYTPALYILEGSTPVCARPPMTAERLLLSLNHSKK